MTASLKPYPAMKDSGVPWLGKVPEHWQTERAKWLFRKMDRSVREQDEVVTCFRDGAVTLRKNRRVRGFTESLKEIGYQGVRRGDLVIHAMDAFAGAIGVSDSDGKGTPVYSVCQPGPNANAHFFAFLVREMARSQWIVALAKGIRERSTDFRFDCFESQNVPLPPLSEQAAIVLFLDYMDRRIRRYIRIKQKLIKLLEEQKQAIIHRAVTSGLDPTVRLKPSGVEWLGDVPQHWEVGPLKRFVARRPGAIKAGPFGSQLTAAEMVGSDVKVYTQRNVIDRDLDGGVNYISYAKFETMRAFQVFSGDLLVTSRGTIGRTALVTENCQLGILHPCLLRVQPDGDRLIPEFLMMLIQDSQLLPQQLTLLSNATTIDVIYSGTLANIIVPVPLKDEQHAIVSAVVLRTASIAAARSRAQREISLLHEYRTRLIADVVTGKLDVREAAERLPDEVDESVLLDDVEETADNVTDDSAEEVANAE